MKDGISKFLILKTRRKCLKNMLKTLNEIAEKPPACSAKQKVSRKKWEEGNFLAYGNVRFLWTQSSF